MKKFFLALKTSWSNLKLKPRLIILNFSIIIITTSIITSVILNRSKRIIEENSNVLILDSIKQINKNIDEMLNTQVYSVSKFIMYDEDIYDYITRYNEEIYKGSRKKDVDTFLIRKKVLKQYFMQEEQMYLAAIINDSDVIYNLSYPAQEEHIVKEFLNNKINQNNISKDLLIRWYPLTNNIFTTRNYPDDRINNVVVANRNIVKSDTGKYIGQQIYTISEKSIYEKYENSNIVKQGIVFIIDSKGELVSHSKLEKVKSKNLFKEHKIIKEILNNPDRNFFVNDSNKLVIQQPLNNNNWITIAVMPTDVIYKSINRSYLLYIILIVVILIFAGILIALTSDKIVKPIKKIINSMEVVDKGNLDVNVEIEGQYEVSKLADYYNNMIKRINKLIQEEYVLEEKKKEAEFDALMAQINPHFLYNTLESIVWKARAIDAHDISDMAYSLGKFFRSSINKGRVIVSIQEEINHVNAYINIQKIRYGNKFDLIFDLENESIREFKTLKLILQPIVENAIMYGIEPMEGKGHIIISIVESNKNIVFTIEDNGKGISEEKLIQLNEKLSYKLEDSMIDNNENNSKVVHGIGIFNVDKRIKLYFGEEYGLKIESMLNHGTSVRIILPKLDT